MQKEPAIELDITQAKNLIARRNLYLELSEIPQFKAFIEGEYFKEEAARLVLFRASPATQTPEKQFEVDKRIDGIGYLKQYFITVVGMGNIADKTLRDSLATQQELMDEESELPELSK